EGDPCSGEPGISASLVVHGDGSVTAIRMDDAFTNTEAERVGVWVGHFDGDGNMLWSDDGLLEARSGTPILSAALARDPSDGAGLAAGRADGHDSSTSVYRLGGPDKHEHMFTAEGTSRITALATAGDDLWVTGFYWPEDNRTPNHPELTRYR